jgi:CheY-specific phosphatase CheX
MVEVAPRELLSWATQEVLEIMFFTEVLGPAEFAWDCTEPFVTVRVGFRVRPAGYLGLCVSAAAARGMAANFLGENEAELSENQIADVVAELSNMVCGRVVSRLASNTSFDLQPPQPTTPEVAIEQVAPGHCFEMENGILAVALSLEPSE